jgi:hypothetical protein
VCAALDQLVELPANPGSVAANGQAPGVLELLAGSAENAVEQG